MGPVKVQFSYELIQLARPMGRVKIQLSYEL